MDPLELIPSMVPSTPVDARTAARVDWIRQLLEQLSQYYGLPASLPPAHPSWLSQVPLDGYDERRGLAFKYDDASHYQLNHPYNRQEDPYCPRRALLARRVGDRWVDWKCAVNRVALIRISYQARDGNLHRRLRRKCVRALGQLMRWTDDDWEALARLELGALQRALNEYYRASAR